MLYHQIDALRAIRRGRFKYHDRHRVLYGNPANFAWAPWRDCGPWLFDLASDPDEAYDVTDTHPAEVAELRELLERWSADLEANPRGWR